jgi:cytochrome c oxidase accessory protein FixG
MTANDDKRSSKAAGAVLDAPEEVLTTLRNDGTRRWMYPVLNTGKWFKKRVVVGYGLILLFFALPIIKIGGEPAIWLDVVHRRFVVLGQIFYPTDTALLMLMGITSLLGIAWLTALFGRVWCGWGCPQTVYLELVFRPIERWIEGKANARRKLDEKEEWTPSKVKKKVLKFGIFGLLSAIMAHNFVAYFISWKILREWMVHSPTEHWGVFILTFGVTALVFFDFAYFREQMCTIACPYARLQSVLMDADSLIVSYDAGRGEPRGRRRRDDEAANETLGSCVDCNACVRACPTGIDIRNGLQLECIGCTQCIDACDDVMAKLAQPGGLIRYTSERALEEKKTRIARPRIFIYTALCLLFGGLFVAGVMSNRALEVDVVRATGAPFIEVPDGQIANRLKVRVRNRSGSAHDVQIEVSEPEGASLRVVGLPTTRIEPGEMKRIEVWVLTPRGVFRDGRSNAHLIVGDGSERFEHELDFALVGPDDLTPSGK